ncbi:MAG TPA: hypothetical protein VLG11_05260 [Candidatus Saccharimonadales bacterium]|nr:hypothetical protein [Candidatus Saccharimonadales bacterium]
MGKTRNRTRPKSSGFWNPKVRHFPTTPLVRLVLFACLLAVGQIAFHSSSVKAGTGINQQINYQARLLNTQGATVPDGSYNIQFKIYKNGDGTTAGDASGVPAGTLLWTEKWQNSNSQGVTVKNGYFSVQLGSICALTGGSCQGNTNTSVDFNQSVLFLSVNVGGTSSGASPTYDGEMLPMRQMAAAPYAFNAGLLGGLSSSQFVQFAPNSVQADSSTNNSIFLNKTGSSGNIIDLQKAGTDVLVLNNSGQLGVGTNAPQNTLSVSPTQYNTGTASQSGTTITGSGTTWTSSMVGDQMTFANGTVAFITGFTSTTSLTASVSQTVSSQAYTLSYVGLQVSSSGNVGIGQATPTRIFDVAVNNAQIAAPMELLENNGTGDASIELKSASSGSSFYVGQDTSNSGAFAINSSTAATPNGVTFVQTATASPNAIDGGTNPITQAFASSVTSGNLIIAAFAWSHSGGSETFSCGDSLSNTFSSTSVYHTGATTELGVCWAITSSSGSDTISATLPASRIFTRMVVSEYHNTSGTPLDVSAVSTATAATTTGSNNATTASATTTQANDLVFGAIEDTGNAGLANLSAGTGYTSRGIETTPDNDRFMTEDKIQATAASTAATFTDGFGSGQQYLAVMVAFKAAPATITDTFSNSLFTISQTGATKLQNSSNSTAEFAIQNSSGTQLLAVDSTNSRILVGNGSTGTTTPTILVLNSKTTSGDPTGVEGAMYYNNAIKSFRCYVDGTWRSCSGGAVYTQTNLPGGDSIANTTSITAFTESYTILGNDCVTGRMYRLTAGGIFTVTTTGTNSVILTLKLGTTVLLATPALVLPNNTTSTTANTWLFDADIQCYQGNPNATGNINAQGSALYASNSTGSTVGAGIPPNSNANSNGYVTLDTTTNQTLTLSATWSVASSANIIQLRQFTLEAVGP